MVYHKQQTITKKILDYGRDSKQLFSVVNSITNNRQINPQPDHKSHEEIANDFADFFIGKIQTIRDELSSAEGFKPQVSNIPQLKQFSSLKMEEVQNEIMSMKNKSCKLNAIPTNLLKEILPSCNETITHIVNTSLTKGIFVNNWKTAIVCPLLKKHGLDLLMGNRRTVSSLCFLSKLVKCCMLKQLINHCNTNCLIPNFQSAYRENYSTETSLIRMCNDTLWSIEKQQITMTVILDLLATFDMVDHNILLDIL